MIRIQLQVRMVTRDLGSGPVELVEARFRPQGSDTWRVGVFATTLQLFTYIKAYVDNRI